jgi:hypothetical protein
MSSAADRRAEAIERISRVRAEVEAKEAAQVAKAEAVKQRKRETKRRWAENNPEKAKALQAKKNAKKNERINARLASDPAYREERKAKRQEKYQESKERLAAKRRARLEEVKAMRDKLTQLSNPTPTEDTMNTDDKNILEKIKAGEADMGRYMVMLDDIKLEEAALAEGDSFVINAPYSHLVNEAVRDDIAERRAAVEWKFKRAAIAVWMYRTEANRRGLL